MVSKEDMLIGGLLEELASAKADVAELKDGEESFGVVAVEDAEMEGALGCWRLACKFSWEIFVDTVKDEPVVEGGHRLGVMALLPRSRTESIVTPSAPAEPFTMTRNGDD